MSIRIIAKELYRLQKEVERLEKELDRCPPEKRDELRIALAEAKAARDKARNALEGVKEPPPYRKPR
ncbi:MAG: hypothetical protein DRH12_05890 [Deltaproteobacteria bacterium]|nr:MAG: hypothetical protein DRH12_05890 [Deltaproteobacteria bacterium]